MTFISHAILCMLGGELDARLRLDKQRAELEVDEQVLERLAADHRLELVAVRQDRLHNRKLPLLGCGGRQL